MARGKHPSSNGGLNFDLEAVRNCLHGLALTCNHFGNYMVVMESEINIILSGQPYVAFMLLFNMKTGKYFARIWNKTVVSGEATSEEEISQACSTFFSQGRPCLGCPVDDSKDNSTTNDFIISQTPIRRKYSNACHKRLGQGFPSDVNKCSECLKLMNFKLEAESEYDEIKDNMLFGGLQAKTEQEISEELEDQEDYVKEGDIFPPEESSDEKSSKTVNKSILKYHHKKLGKYPQIITEALLQAEDNMLCLKDIYKYIEEKHPYVGHDVPGWQNSIRHTLSINHHFQNIHAPKKGVGGGKYGRVWTFTSATDPSLNDDGIDAQPEEHEGTLCLGGLQTKTEQEFSEELEDLDNYVEEGEHQHDIFPPEESFHEKPSQTVTQLISQALREAKTGMLSIIEICSFISQKYPYYDAKVNGWQDDVREQLSDNQYFREIGNTGSEGSRWALSSEGRPSLKYPQLIEEALEQAEDKMLPLCDIISYIEDKYPFYRSDYRSITGQSWKTSIRQSLSITARFQNVPAPHIRGKSGMWKICHEQNVRKTTDPSKQGTISDQANDTDKGKGEVAKPPFTYAQLITQAFEQSQGRMLSLHAVCLFISEKYPYYAWSEKRWKETVGQMLSINSEFQRIGGKRNSWKLIDGTEIECPQCKRLFNSDDVDEYRIHTQECRQVEGEHVKPALTYPELVCEAFEHSENRVLTMKEICSYICETHPFYSLSKKQSLEHSVYDFLHRSVKYQRIGDKFLGGSWKLIDGTEVECPKCHKLYQSADNEYYNHMRKKHAYGTFTCPSGCNITADYAKDIIDHIQKETHHEELLVKCPSCEKQIPTNDLESHYKACVTLKLAKREKQLCTICGKHIIFKSYKRHMKTHLGEQPLYHYCDQCGKRYSQPGDLKQHIRAQHKGVKLQCKLCSQEFKTRSEVWAHKNLMHSSDERYICKKCNIRYGTLSRLRHHMMTHEAPQFECKYCGKKIVHKSQLLRHEKIHIGEKTYQCPVKTCGKMWIDNSSLAKHKKQVHKIFGKGRKLNPTPVTMKAV